MDFFTEQSRIIDENSATELYFDTLKESVRRKINETGISRFGFFLSGGLDSSANVARGFKKVGGWNKWMFRAM